MIKTTFGRVAAVAETQKASASKTAAAMSFMARSMAGDGKSVELNAEHHKPRTTRNTRKRFGRILFVCFVAPAAR